MKPPAKIPVSLLRGGTSKAVLVSSKDLPTSPSQREALLLNLLGQANVFGQQINGLGGGHASASKLAIVGPSTRNDCDVDFTFGALSPSYLPTNTAKIDWSSSCTHTVAAVALFAIDQALLAPNEPSRAATQSAQKTETLVRIWQVNLGQVIHAYVPMNGQQIDESSEVMEFNQAMRGALVRLEFFESSFLQSSPWLPTAHTKQNLSLGSQGKLEVTLLGCLLYTSPSPRDH
jgi:2-methylaconitate cis-trans-isomerase PrpF